MSACALPDAEEGDTLSLPYESKRTGSHLEAEGEVTCANGRLVKLYDEQRHRTIRLRAQDGVVETRERRGHWLELGPYLEGEV